MPEAHQFMYSPTARIRLDPDSTVTSKVSDLEAHLQTAVDGIVITDAAGTVITKIPKNAPFNIRIDPPDYDPMPTRLKPRYAKVGSGIPKPNRSSMMLGLLVFDVSDLATVVRTTPMLAGMPLRNPERRKASRRRINKQVFKFDKTITAGGFNPGSTKVLVAAHSLHQFFDVTIVPLNLPKTILAAKAVDLA